MVATEWHTPASSAPVLRFAGGFCTCTRTHKQRQLQIFLWNGMRDDTGLRTQIRVLHFRAWSCTVRMHNLTNLSKECFFVLDLDPQEKDSLPKAQGYGLVKTSWDAGSKSGQIFPSACWSRRQPPAARTTPARNPKRWRHANVDWSLW